MRSIALLSAFCLVLIAVLLSEPQATDLKLFLSAVSGVLVFLLAVSFRCWRLEVR